MCLKFLVLFVFFVQRYFCITTNGYQNETAGMLWDLSNYALQSRQNYAPHTPPHYYNQPNQISNPYKPYPSYAKPYPYQPILPNQYNQKPPYPFVNPGQHYQSYPYNPQAQRYPPQRESVMDILHSVATNDDLQCVPKIICEVTSGTMGGRQSPIGLPLNVNLESLVGLLSAWNGLQTSPLLHFGKAALLGYTSKGNTRSCGFAYPECPAEPDRLVQYLNNHNGGFFRYFNGIHPTNTQGYAPQYHQYQHHNQYQNINTLQNYSPYYRKRAHAERRIQNKPERYIPLNHVDNGQRVRFQDNSINDFYDTIRQYKGLAFPPNNDQPVNLEQTHYNSFKFPDNNKDDSVRRPKTFVNDLSYYRQQNEILDFQKPLPNHQATQNIFPDRTGTGELKLDSDELGFGGRPTYEDDNVVINLNNFVSNRGSREIFDRQRNDYSEGALVNFP